MLKTFIAKIICYFMVLVTFMSISDTFAVDVSAATSGGNNTTTIIINSKKNYWYPGSSSITLAQSKTTIKYAHIYNSRKTKTKSYYSYYIIDVYNFDTGRSETIYWNSTRTKKIKLNGNQRYSITVRPNYQKIQLKDINCQPGGYKQTEYACSSWWVSSTWKINSYY